MPLITELPPLSVYIHIPWCVKKCPYCDFNSHELKIKNTLPEEIYTQTLLQEFERYIPFIQQRAIISLFFGGGTPSLFSGKAIGTIIDGIAQRANLSTTIEITLEANPGTVEQAKFRDFHLAGVNRLSIGVQSFQDDKLRALGRIHDQAAAQRAAESAQQAGLTNFNIDLMYGLPNQSIADALHDLHTALAFQPPHLSWYQLTLEPNTLFHHQPPMLPSEDLIWEMQQAGQALLQENNYQQYEVSAYARPSRQCQHNLNYWQFGDYIGIGAGAHSKVTRLFEQDIIRFAQVKNPRDYLDKMKRDAIEYQKISPSNLIFEFMLNALRLQNGFRIELFTARTGIAFSQIAPVIEQAIARKLLARHGECLQPTELGRRYLNDLVQMFL